MDDEEERFTLGLGKVVRAAAQLEYALHGLAAHLRGADLAYGEPWAAEMATQHIKMCEQAVADPQSTVPEHARSRLLADLEPCRKALERRNMFVHCCWIFDDEETWQWQGVKADRAKGKKGSLLIEPADSDDLWELTAELERLGERLLAWDIEHFGEDGDPDEGEPPRVSVKRVL